MFPVKLNYPHEQLRPCTR